MKNRCNNIRNKKLKAAPKPSKELIEKLKGLGLTGFALHFSAGSDQPELDIDLQGSAIQSSEAWGLLEDWAEKDFGYKEFNEGDPYGADFEYDLENMRVSHSEWAYVREHSVGWESLRETEEGK